MRRIAIITSETPNSHDAGSMQLLRVFKDYPAEKLLVLGPVPPPNATLLDCPYRELKFPIMRLRNTRLHRVAMTAVLSTAAFQRSPHHITRLLHDFDPEAVFTVMDNFSHYYTAFRFARARGLPLVTVTMDEPDCFERIYPAFHSLRHRKIREVYQYAANNLCVSRQMKAHIAESFHCTTETFYFGPPDGQSPRPVRESALLRQTDHLTVGYAGSLSYGYGQAIERISLSLRGKPVTIRIYSKDRPSWDDLTGIEYAGVFKSEELWTHVKRDCDASLLVYNFDYANSRLYRTHFPTKLSEYAWLGLPMVMSGPDYATGVIWGLDHPQAAVVDTTQSLSAMPDLLSHLHRDASKRVAMAESAGAAARTEFDPEKIRHRFHEVLKGT